MATSSSAAAARQILGRLEQVGQERRLRRLEPSLGAAVDSVKAYQQQRFRHTYADLLASPRYGPGALFFVEDLYGPADFSQRDEDFARVVPALVRLFPQEVIETVAALAELHALSETLDTAMGRANGLVALDVPAYVAAWRAVGEPAMRNTQLALLLAVGRALDTLTRKPLLRGALTMMRGPAKAAGMEALQSFLERGFDRFRAMKGAADFLSTIEEREGALIRQLSDPAVSAAELAGQLPRA